MMMHGCAAAVPPLNVKFLGLINPTEAAPLKPSWSGRSLSWLATTSG